MPVQASLRRQKKAGLSVVEGSRFPVLPALGFSGRWQEAGPEGWESWEMAQVLHLGTRAVFTGYMVLAQCQTLLASVGASCHSDHEDR